MGRFMSPDPSGLFYANPYNPQSLNLYGYVMNNPLSNVDPTGLDCVYINNDTGAYGGFSSGDCDNSTEARANSGYYVDGTVNQISFNGQGQVTGYDANTSSGMFDSYAGSLNPGATAANLNPYTNALSASGQSVNVTANSPQSLSTIGSTLTTLIHGPLPTPNPYITHYVSAYNPTRRSMTGDPACYFAPDAVSAIHSLRQGNVEGPPQATTDGEGAISINQNTTAGARSYGNPTGYAGAAAGAMIVDDFVSIQNCLQGR
jgi:hypothetical protein